MIPYVLAAAAGLVLGLAASRRPGALLLPRLRGLWLLVPILALAFLPYWLDRTAPERIWSSDRDLLLAILTLRQSLLIFLIVLNLLPRHFPVLRPLRRLWRQSVPRMKQWARQAKQQLQARLLPSPANQRRQAVQRVQAVQPDRPATRWWHRLPMLGLLLAVALQTAVLLENKGYMPLTVDYLKEIDNPALMSGIRNGALQLYALVGPATAFPSLALQYRLPLIEHWFPAAFPYYGLADLIGAASLAFTLFLQFFGRRPGQLPRRRRRQRQAEIAESVEPAVIAETVESVETVEPAECEPVGSVELPESIEPAQSIEAAGFSESV